MVNLCDLENKGKNYDQKKTLAFPRTNLILPNPALGKPQKKFIFNGIKAYTLPPSLRGFPSGQIKLTVSGHCTLRVPLPSRKSKFWR